MENNRQKRELRSLRDENKNIKEVNHALNTQGQNLEKQLDELSSSFYELESQNKIQKKELSKLSEENKIFKEKNETLNKKLEKFQD